MPRGAAAFPDLLAIDPYELAQAYKGGPHPVAEVSKTYPKIDFKPPR